MYIGSQDGNFYALDAVTGARRWAFYGSVAMSVSSAAVGEDGTVYFAQYDVAGARVYALHGATEAGKWAFAYDHTVPGYSSPAIGADGTVYTVLCVQRGPFPSWSLLFALDGASGEEKWMVNLNGYAASSPAVGSDGTVYIGSDHSPPSPAATRAPTR